MKKLKLDDGYYYIDDPDIKTERKIALEANLKQQIQDDLEQTSQINIITEEDLLNQTLTDIWGEQND